MKTLQSHQAFLLTLVVALPLTACDAEGDVDRSANDLELTDDEENPTAALHPVDLDLVSDAPGPLASVAQVWVYEGVVQLSKITDADVVMLKNLSHGYVGCDSSGTIKIHHNPVDIDGYVWKVHRTDIDGDGTDELQLELIDGTGETGTYLKMNASDEVSCASITGIGDAAGWNLGASFAGLGTYYQRVVKQLVNYKQGQCLKIDSGDGEGASCSGVAQQVFNIEILTNAG